mmetsp:Transcript_33999/g.39986  ORF Transcript_33999/g.39986 Transcript_33999/m.39986 type:complete len:216 (+) Transcript_33999:380-1027(+)
MSRNEEFGDRDQRRTDQNIDHAESSDSINHHEGCSICLGRFQHGDNINILPCFHQFHASCIGEWLTKWNGTCPLCKEPALPSHIINNNQLQQTYPINNQNEQYAEEGRRTLDRPSSLFSRPYSGIVPTTSPYQYNPIDFDTVHPQPYQNIDHNVNLITTDDDIQNIRVRMQRNIGSDVEQLPLLLATTTTHVVTGGEEDDRRSEHPPSFYGSLSS